MKSNEISTYRHSNQLKPTQINQTLFCAFLKLLSMPVDILPKFFLTVSLICTIALTHATKAGFMIKDLGGLTAEDFSACQKKT